MSKPTGPWYVEDRFDRFVIFQEGSEREVASLPIEEDALPAEMVAVRERAHLISAAPELLEAAQEMLAVLDSLERDRKWAGPIADKCRDAIAKAEVGT